MFVLRFLVYEIKHLVNVPNSYNYSFSEQSVDRQVPINYSHTYFLKFLFRYLNAVETLYVENNVPAKYNAQDFDYLLVLDFEATCWDMKDIHKKAPEIIEFPCILFDIQKRVNVAEFQQYVMPRENHKLSSFCTQLTGNNNGMREILKGSLLFIFIICQNVLPRYLNKIQCVVTNRYNYKM